VGKKTGPNPPDRGKSGVKRRLLTEGQGVPIGLVVEGAHRHDMKLVRATVESLIVARPEPTPDQPQGMGLDAGYDYDEVWAMLKEFGLTAHVRPRGEAAPALKRAAGFKARRWVVERAHSWMNRFRRRLIRWDKKPENYLAFLHFAWGLMALRAAGVVA
jgi:putative transposase